MSVPPVGTPVRVRTTGSYGNEILVPGQVWATAGSDAGEFAAAGLPSVSGESVAHVLAWAPIERNAGTSLLFNITEGDANGQFRRVDR